MLDARNIWVSLFYNWQQLPQEWIKKPSGDPIEQGSASCETWAKFGLQLVSKMKFYQTTTKHVHLHLVKLKTFTI